MAELATQSAVEVSGLTKVFESRSRSAKHGDVVAVSDVSFSVAKGGSLAIVGESGSGKTTIARILIGLERSTGGKIVIAGRDRSAPPRGASERMRRAREAQIVFQDPYTTLDPRQSAAQCLDEIIRIHFRRSRNDRKHRIATLRDMVGLDERTMDAKPRTLSGGQRQRVAIARALAVEPSVLILDEAVAALDVSIQAQVLNVLVDIRSQTGATYIFISHDLGVVRQISDETIVLRSGSIVERGETGAVLEHPGHPYTQALIEAVPRPGWRPLQAASLIDHLEETEGVAWEAVTSKV